MEEHDSITTRVGCVIMTLVLEFHLACFAKSEAEEKDLWC